MEIKPVKQKRKPGYPTITTFAENPSLLSKHVPIAWIRNQYAATTLATFILCGTVNQTNGQKVKPASAIVSQHAKKQIPAGIKSVQQDSVKVARIFSHGDGTGAIGCIVSSPPVFMSEDEALKIIFTALKAENIEFNTTNTPVLKFLAPQIASPGYDRGINQSGKKVKVEIHLAGYNAQYNLAIEYVSVNEFKKFKEYHNTKTIVQTDRKTGKKFVFIAPEDVVSTVEEFDTKQAAFLIRDELANQAKTNAAVFYDPIYYPNPYPSFEEMISSVHKPNSRDLLLAQVKDFIDWIKQEGIIK